MSFVKELSDFAQIHVSAPTPAPGTDHGPRGLSYKDQVPFIDRVAESHKIRLRYPDRIPVIVEVSSSSTDIPDLDKKKYLVPNNLTMGQFICVIRSRIKLGAESAIFAFVDNTIVCTGELMSSVYERRMEQDGFLYILLTSENTFGL